MKRKSLLMALPFLAASSLLLSACSDNNDLTGNESNAQNGVKLVLDFSNTTSNSPLTRVSVSSEYEKAGTADGTGVRHGADNNGRNPFGADNVESTGKLVKALAYNFNVGDELYIYDETSHDISTFICSKVEDTDGTESTTAGASAPKAAEFTATDLKTITAGSPIYLFTNNKPTWDGSQLNFQFDTDTKKNYAFGRNGSKLDGTLFTGFQKIAAAPNINASTAPVRLKATLDETPVMVTYHDDILQDFKAVTMKRSVKPFGTTTRGHYTSATYDFANNTLLPGSFTSGEEVYTWDGSRSTDPNSFYSNDGAEVKGLTIDGVTGVHRTYNGGRTTYVPLMPGKYAEVRYLVSGTLKQNAEGTTSKLQLLASKTNETSGFEVKKNEYFNFGSVSDANVYGETAAPGYNKMAASSLYILGDATQYGWDKGIDKDSTFAFSISQKMVNNGDGTFTYIGKPLSKDKSLQQLPTVTRNESGKNKYIFMFNNPGELEAPGLFMSDNSYKRPGDSENTTTGTDRVPGSATPVSGSKNSQVYYSTFKDHYTSEGLWELPFESNAAGAYYKFKVDLNTKMLEVTKFTGGVVGDNNNNTNAITLPTQPLYITVPTSSTNNYTYTSPSGHAKYAADYATEGVDQATKDFANTDVKVEKLWLTGTAVSPFYAYGRTSAPAFVHNLALNARLGINPNYFVWEGKLKEGYLRFPYIFAAELTKHSKYLSAKYTGTRNDAARPNAMAGRNDRLGNPMEWLVYPVEASLDGTWNDMSVEKDEPDGGRDCEWHIATEGFYRIIVDVENMKVSFKAISENDALLSK